MRGWTIRDSLDLYNVASWGAGYFDINAKGHVEAGPGPTSEPSTRAPVEPNPGDRSATPRIDLLDLVRDLEQRGLRTPLLIRFSDILASRVRSLGDAFDQAIREYDYKGRHRGVYPIKVNQQRHVVEEIIQHGAPRKVGIEAGS